jgi:hypothetical protein
METIQSVPHSLSKSDIRKAAEHYGKVNSKKVILDGQIYKAKELTFVSFVGDFYSTNVYEGCYHFSERVDSDSEAFDFNDLPKFEGK